VKTCPSCHQSCEVWKTKNCTYLSFLLHFAMAKSRFTVPSQNYGIMRIGGEHKKTLNVLLMMFVCWGNLAWKKRPRQKQKTDPAYCSGKKARIVFWRKTNEKTVCERQWARKKNENGGKFNANLRKARKQGQFDLIVNANALLVAKKKRMRRV